jgi:hypothetical protein
VVNGDADHIVNSDVGNLFPPGEEKPLESKDGEADAGNNVPPGQKAGAGANRKERRAGRKRQAKPAPAPPGKYNVVIVDPPWPVEKIDRDVRPN